MSTTTSAFIQQVVGLKQDITKILQLQEEFIVNKVIETTNMTLDNKLKQFETVFSDSFKENQLRMQEQARQQKEYHAKEKIKTNEFIKKLNTQAIEKRTEERIGNIYGFTTSILAITCSGIAVLFFNQPIEVLYYTALFSSVHYVLQKGFGQHIYKSLEHCYEACGKKLKKCWNFICRRPTLDRTHTYQLSAMSKELELQNIMMIALPDDLNDDEKEKLQKQLWDVVNKFSARRVINISNENQLNITSSDNDTSDKKSQCTPVTSKITSAQSLKPTLPNDNKSELELSAGESFTPAFTSSATANANTTPATNNPNIVTNITNIATNTLSVTNIKRASVSQISISSSPAIAFNSPSSSPRTSTLVATTTTSESTPHSPHPSTPQLPNTNSPTTNPIFPRSPGKKSKSNDRQITMGKNRANRYDRPFNR